MKDDKDSQVYAYWNNKKHNPVTIGVGAIGTGLPIEHAYRMIGELETLRPYLPKAPFSMLELGCGAGRWGFALAQSLSCYEGVDLSEQQITYATQLAEQKKLRQLAFFPGNINEYTPRQKQFDVIYFSGVSQYLDDKDLGNIIRRYMPFLAPGGRIIERATTFVGENRYVRDDEGEYWCIYRLSKEIIAVFEQQGLLLVADEQSYTFLRRPELWRSPELSFFADWGLQHVPTAMYSVMKAFSASISSKHDPYCHEGDKVYDHRFFIFSQNNDAK